jgi:hypothetical protein
MKHIRLFAWLTGLVSISVAASQNTAQLPNNPCPNPVKTQASIQPTPAKISNELLPQPVNPALHGLAPKSARVDLTKPTFTNPTIITHPLFPTGKVFKTLLLGKVDGLALHVEYTLLPNTKVFQWNGQSIKTLEVQYAAHLNGRVKELALDWYAQADDGSVWYFGEDVFNYEEGSAADTKGTWQAGRDGTPAMIMPAKLQVGKAFRVENIPGVAFEEITIKATDATVYGPSGTIKGAMVGRQLHMDGSYSNKTFAPNYGEFVTITDTEHEALALAIPTNALECSVPSELETLSSGAIKIFDTVRSDAWAQASNSRR